MRLALRHAVDAQRDLEAKIADLGAELRAARRRPDFPDLVREVHDAHVVSVVELAKLAGVSRTYVYELLERRGER